MQKGGFGRLFLLSKVKINTHFYFSKVKKRNFTERKTEIKDIRDSFVVTNRQYGNWPRKQDPFVAFWLVVLMKSVFLPLV